MDITIRIDHALCQGHGQCQDTAPGIFEVRDDGLAHVIGQVPASSLDLARDAASRCPADAITVIES